MLVNASSAVFSQLSCEKISEVLAYASQTISQAEKVISFLSKRF